MARLSTQSKALRASGGLILLAFAFWIGGLFLKSSQGQSFYDGTNPVLTASHLTKFSTTTSNLSAPTVISVGSSPFNFTNTSGVNIFIFVSGGIVSSVAINGGVITPVLTLTSATTAPLQPNEYVTVTYTSVPMMKYKPY